MIPAQTQERLADAGVLGSWTLFGFSSLAQINELLTTLSLLAATFASMAAGVFYLRRRK